MTWFVQGLPCRKFQECDLLAINMNNRFKEQCVFCGPNWTEVEDNPSTKESWFDHTGYQLWQVQTCDACCPSFAVPLMAIDYVGRGDERFLDRGIIYNLSGQVGLMIFCLWSSCSLVKCRIKRLACLWPACPFVFTIFCTVRVSGFSFHLIRTDATDPFRYHILNAKGAFFFCFRNSASNSADEMYPSLPKTWSTTHETAWEWLWATISRNLVEATTKAGVEEETEGDRRWKPRKASWFEKVKLKERNKLFLLEYNSMYFFSQDRTLLEPFDPFWKELRRWVCVHRIRSSYCVCTYAYNIVWIWYATEEQGDNLIEHTSECDANLWTWAIVYCVLWFLASNLHKLWRLFTNWHKILSLARQRIRQWYRTCTDGREGLEGTK